MRVVIRKLINFETQYAIGTLDSPPGPPSKIYGAKATFNVWRPKVEQATEFSLAQIWIISGSYDNNTLNSIEAGWQVSKTFLLNS